MMERQKYRYYSNGKEMKKGNFSAYYQWEINELLKDFRKDSRILRAATSSGIEVVKVCEETQGGERG